METVLFLYLSKINFRYIHFWKKYLLMAIGDYPAFFRFLTKKSFSLVSKSNFDFLSCSLNSGVKFFFILLGFISWKSIHKKWHIRSYRSTKKNVDIFSQKEKLFYFAHRRCNLINILWKTLLKNTKKVDNSRGAWSKQAFLL